MEYPKPIMKKSELRKMGFSEEYLTKVYNDPKQDFAWKMDIRKVNSHILFDTAKFEQYRLKQIKTDQLARSHHIAII